MIKEGREKSLKLERILCRANHTVRLIARRQRMGGSQNLKTIPTLSPSPAAATKARNILIL